LDEHCRRLSEVPGQGKPKKRRKDKLHCEKAPPTENGFAFALPENKLDGDWREVRFIRTGPKETPTIHLAMRTTEGWYVSAALLSGAEASSLSDAKLVARDLSDQEGRRHVFGFISTEQTNRYVSCGLSEAAPACVAIPTQSSKNLVTAVPGGVLSVGSEIALDTDEPKGPGPYH
jgi:hypothetical protein